jgi:hypothetical protein
MDLSVDDKSRKEGYIEITANVFRCSSLGATLSQFVKM